MERVRRGVGRGREEREDRRGGGRRVRRGMWIDL